MINKKLISQPVLEYVERHFVVTLGDKFMNTTLKYNVI